MLDERGREIPDPTPIALPLGMGIPETLAQQIQRMVKSELSRQAEAQGHDSFEDADDFDVGDDDELRSPYELSDENFEDVNGSDDRSPSERKPVGEQAADANVATAAAGSPATGESGTAA